MLCLVSGQNPQLWTNVFPQHSVPLTTLLCQVSSRVPLGHLSAPGWTLHGAHMECPDHIIIPVLKWSLKSVYVFSPVLGVSGVSETCFQSQFSQVIAVLDLSSLLLIYYLRKKRTLLTHTMNTLFLLSKWQLQPVLLRLEGDENGSRD